MSRVLVIIPAYNEEKRIAAVVAGVYDAVPEAVVVVINDCSRDATTAAARQAGAVVVSHPFNMGYGAAIQTGYKYARDKGYDYLVQLDADGQHDPACIPELLAPVLAGQGRYLHRIAFSRKQLPTAACTPGRHGDFSTDSNRCNRSSHY